MPRFIFITGGVVSLLLCAGLAYSAFSRDASTPDYYETLRNKCAGSSCCLASVKRMESGGFRLAEGGLCPEGKAKNMLKCIQSYSWCIPVKAEQRN